MKYKYEKNKKEISVKNKTRSRILKTVDNSIMENILEDVKPQFKGKFGKRMHEIITRSENGPFVTDLMSFQTKALFERLRHWRRECYGLAKIKLLKCHGNNRRNIIFKEKDREKLGEYLYKNFGLPGIDYKIKYLTPEHVNNM